MKISILIAAVRGSAPIDKTLASVSAQTDTDWELVVASNVRRPDIESAIRQLGFTRPARHECLTALRDSAALRNWLIAASTGDALVFLDPSDSWTPRHLANALEALHQGADVVVSDAHATRRQALREGAKVRMPQLLATSPVRALFSSDLIPGPSCVVVRRSTVVKTGAFDPRFRAAECWDFWLRCAVTRARFALTEQLSCTIGPPALPPGPLALWHAEQAVLFYEKHRDLAAVPAALRRRLLISSLVTHGRLLRPEDAMRAARCFWRAWSLQPVQVQTLGQFALTGWHGDDDPRARNQSGTPGHG